MEIVKSGLICLGIAVVAILCYENSAWFHTQANTVQKNIPNIKK